MDAIQKRLLEEVSGLHAVPEGAYNLRANGQSVERSSTENIQITSKEDGKGIDIHIADGTQNESVHIPVVLSQSGLTEVVYNDFFIGDNCDVVIVAAAESTTAEIPTASTTASTASLSERIPKSNTWRSTTEAETEWANGF